MAFLSDLTDFGAFYERTYQRAYRTALGILHDHAVAGDVTQESYVAAYRTRSKFRGDAPGEAWLHQIVVNTSLMAVRRRGPAVRELAVEPIVDDAGREATDRVALFTALAELDPRQRAAVVLRYYHDYDYATIARILGTSTSNVGVILTRSLARLRTVLEGPSRAKELGVAADV